MELKYNEIGKTGLVHGCHKRKKRILPDAFSCLVITLQLFLFPLPTCLYNNRTHRILCEKRAMLHS
jgi:hypothetical protein